MNFHLCDDNPLSGPHVPAQPLESRPHGAERASLNPFLWPWSGCISACLLNAIYPPQRVSPSDMPTLVQLLRMHFPWPEMLFPDIRPIP